MNHIHFTVLGSPQAQKRHRNWQRGKARGTYDPSASDKADFLALCRDNAPKRVIEGVVLLYVVFWMPIPKGVSQKKVREMRVPFYDSMSPESIAAFVPRYGLDRTPPSFHTKRPDTDNLIKMIKDTMTSIYWKDDSQVQIGGGYKIYSHRPRTEIEIIW